MKRLTLVAGLFAAMAPMYLQAQTMNLRASIPFDFRIGSAVFPSGEYSVHTDPVGVLFVNRLEGRHEGGVFMTVGSDHPALLTDDGTLSFERYADTYYLSKVWTPASQTARSLIKTSREKELASRVKLTQTATVALRTK